MQPGPSTPALSTPTARAGWRGICAVVLVAACAAGIAGLFWHFDLQYAAPATPPSDPDWQPPALADHVELPPAVRASVPDGRPLLLHFFNPDCPCSRFNVEHLRELRLEHGDRIGFLAVIATKDAAGGRRAFDRLGIEIPSLADPRGEIARLVGVYATPQAVLLDADGQLLFRGNYNVARYCTDPATEYVRLALEALARGATVPAFDARASVAYGCEVEVLERGSNDIDAGRIAGGER